MPKDRKLPHANSAYVERTKVVDYLLNSLHRDGRGKAEFFRRFGFTTERWQELAEALQEVAIANAVKTEVVTEFGTNYVAEGELKTPTGRRVWVRTVWKTRRSDLRHGSSRRIRERLNMINEHELAVLLADLPPHGLEAGDVGTVVSVHRGGEGYTMEFVNLAGETVALATVCAGQVRAVSRRDITHVRELTTA